MKKILMTQSGFSLVQGMILAAALAGSGLVATKMLNEQKMLQKGIESKDQIEELHNVVYSALQNNGNCTKTLLDSGVTAAMTSGSGIKTLPLNNIKTEDGQVIIQKYDKNQSANENLTNRTYMSGNVQVKDINVRYDNATTTGMGEIEIIYERLHSTANVNNAQDDGKRRLKAGYGGKSIRKVIGLRVQRNPVLSAKPFTSCYGVTASKTSDTLAGSTEAGNQDLAKKLCQDLVASVPSGEIPAFRWDDATSSCLPNSSCPDHQIYTGIDSLGVVKCRNLNQWVDFNSMIKPTSGACSPGQQARIEIITNNPVQIRIKCQN